MFYLENDKYMDCGALSKIKGKIELNSLQQRITQLLKEKSIPAKVRQDEYKLGTGIGAKLSKSMPCIAVVREKHAKNYLAIIIVVTYEDGISYISMYYSGHSANEGLRAVWENNKTGSLLEGAVKKHLSHKIDDEGKYYEDVIEIIFDSLETVCSSDVIDIVRKYDFDTEDVEKEFKELTLRDIALARSYIYADSIEKHDIRGMLTLAVSYSFLDKPEDSISILKKLADENNLEAMFRLSRIYEGDESKGPNNAAIKDEKKQFYWLRKAAFGGYIEAYNGLGDYYNFECNDSESAIYWYSMATKKGDVKSYYNRAKLLELEIGNKEINDLTKRQIVRCIERDLHYVFELADDSDLVRNAAMALGLFYRYDLHASVIGEENIRSANLLLSMFFYYVAANCSDYASDLAISECHKLEKENNTTINEENFSAFRDQVLVPYKQEHDLFYYREGTIPQYIQNIVDENIDSANGGDLSSTIAIINGLSYNFSSYENAKEWIDYLVSIDRVNGLFYAGIFYFEYAPHSNNPDEFYRMSESFLSDVYNDLNDSKQRLKASQCLADLYDFYFNEKEKARDYYKNIEKLSQIANSEKKANKKSVEVDERSQPKNKKIASSSEKTKQRKLFPSIFIIFIIFVFFVFVGLVQNDNSRSGALNNINSHTDNDQSELGSKEKQDIDVDENIEHTHSAQDDKSQEYVEENIDYTVSLDEEMASLLGNSVSASQFDGDMEKLLLFYVDALEKYIKYPSGLIPIDETEPDYSITDLDSYISFVEDYVSSSSERLYSDGSEMEYSFSDVDDDLAPELLIYNEPNEYIGYSIYYIDNNGDRGYFGGYRIFNVNENNVFFTMDLEGENEILYRYWYGFNDEIGDDSFLYAPYFFIDKNDTVSRYIDSNGVEMEVYGSIQDLQKTILDYEIPKYKISNLEPIRNFKLKK